MSDPLGAKVIGSYKPPNMMLGAGVRSSEKSVLIFLNHSSVLSHHTYKNHVTNEMVEFRDLTSGMA